MKGSRYNFFVPYKDRVICFNGVSGKVFSVSKGDEFNEVKRYIEAPDGRNNLTNFMVKNNFIVEDLTNEVELFKLNNRIAVFDNSFHLIINPTLECNFSCWYCYEKSIPGKMSDQTQRRIVRLIENLTSGGKIRKLTISWFGGEPMLYLQQVIYPISLSAKELCEKYNVEFGTNATTNGFLISKEKIHFLKEINMSHFQITLDGNKSTHDKVRNQNGRPSFDKIIDNITRICKNIPDVSIILRVNYTNDILKHDISETLSLFPQQIRKNIRVDFQRVWQTRGEKDTTDLLKGINTALDMGFAPSVCGSFSVKKHYQCYVDKFNFAHINFDGKVYRCTARDYSQKYICGELSETGDIIWNAGINEMMFAQSNFDNEMCLSCKLLPICTGPCYQNYRDYKEGRSKTFCFQKDNEIDVEMFIIQYYLTTIKHAENNKI
ncbi:radical SAM protein [Tannerella sp.]|uniref:radical SAM/SPASM domain-containing protein n=1 Tax=Tannerella sp. TaxID=2382127 RepID=UPI0026DCE0BD|nr:radical SAM protein [Tannerella sp.]MDO4704239.1 radical SAM protein [Tannerella sp.]